MLSPRFSGARSTQTSGGGARNSSSGGARSSVAPSSQGTMLEQFPRRTGSGSSGAPPTAGGSSSDESDDGAPAPRSSQGSTRLPSSQESAAPSSSQGSQTLRSARAPPGTYDESLDTQGIMGLLRDGDAKTAAAHERILRSQHDPRDDEDEDEEDEVVESEPAARPLPPPIETGDSGWYSDAPPADSAGFSDDGRDPPPPRRGRSTTTSDAATDIVEDTLRRSLMGFSDNGRRSVGSETRCSPAPRASAGSETQPPSPAPVEAPAPETDGEDTQAYQGPPPERYEYMRPAARPAAKKGQPREEIFGEYTFPDEAESIDDDDDALDPHPHRRLPEPIDDEDEELDPHPHRRLPPVAGSLNSLAAQSQDEETPLPPGPRAAEPDEAYMPWQVSKTRGFSLSSPGSPAAAPPTAGGSSSDESDDDEAPPAPAPRRDSDEFDMAAAMDAPRPAPAPAQLGSGWMHSSRFRSQVRMGPRMPNRPRGTFKPPKPVRKP